jgi:hypothetical protein
MRQLTTLAASLVLSAGALGVAALSPAAAQAPADGRGTAKETSAQLAELRNQLRPLATPEAARAAGFTPAGPCVQEAPGGMGVHYVNFGRMGQPLDPASPQVLLFVPDGKGGLTLGGAEWMKPDADQDLSTDDDRPTMFGRAFDGPMPGHGPGEPAHYDLHVWLFAANPDGVFAPFNPRVSC